MYDVVEHPDLLPQQALDLLETRLRLGARKLLRRDALRGAFGLGKRSPRLLILSGGTVFLYHLKYYVVVCVCISPHSENTRQRSDLKTVDVIEMTNQVSATETIESSRICGQQAHAAHPHSRVLRDGHGVRFRTS